MSNYTDFVLAAIPLIKDCKTLNDTLTKVTSDINDLMSKIDTQMANLAPLMTPPHDLPSTIVWCEAMCQAYVTPYNNLLQQASDLTSKLSEITAAAQQRANELGCQ